MSSPALCPPSSTQEEYGGRSRNTTRDPEDLWAERSALPAGPSRGLGDLVGRQLPTTQPPGSGAGRVVRGLGSGGPGWLWSPPFHPETTGAGRQRPSWIAQLSMTFQKVERMKAARGFKGGDPEGGTELGEWPGSVQPRRPGPRLAEHLVPVEDGLPLLLHLQLPPLLRALHALQDRVRPGPKGGGGRCRARVLGEGEQGVSNA